MSIFYQSILVLFLSLNLTTTIYAADQQFSKMLEFEKNHSINVKIGLIKIPKEYAYRDYIRWGADKFSPNYIVETFSIEINGNKCHVPLSAFSDISNIKDLNLKKIKKGIFISISGGDAALSFSADYLVEKGCYIRDRKIYSNEFPERTWEHTEYSFNMYYDEMN